MNRFLASLSALTVIALSVLPQAGFAQNALDPVLSQFQSESNAALVVEFHSPDQEFMAAVGLAEDQRTASVEDRFRIGSMSKTFVAAAALLLQEDGILNLDDRAALWLSEDVVNSLPNLEQVTLRELLSMRSGIPDYLATQSFQEAVIENPLREWTALDVLQFADGLPARFAPGTAFEYSNTNYILMQLVMESATGKPLHEILRETILDPLELNNTYTQISEELPDGFVAGYSDLDGDGQSDNVSGINDGAGLGDGGLVSTSGDIVTFYKALLEERTLLSEDSLDQMLTFQPGNELGRYGLGIFELATPAGVAWGHSGGVLGFLSVGLYFDASQTTLVALSADTSTDLFGLVIAVLDAVA
jgi:D-alanyl-D-alanine carboxypeptidase